MRAVSHGIVLAIGSLREHTPAKDGLPISERALYWMSVAVALSPWTSLTVTALMPLLAPTRS